MSYYFPTVTVSCSSFQCSSTMLIFFLEKNLVWVIASFTLFHHPSKIDPTLNFLNNSIIYDHQGLRTFSWNFGILFSEEFPFLYPSDHSDSFLPQMHTVLTSYKESVYSFLFPLFSSMLPTTSQIYDFFQCMYMCVYVICVFVFVCMYIYIYVFINIYDIYWFYLVLLISRCARDWPLVMELIFSSSLENRLSLSQYTLNHCSSSSERRVLWNFPHLHWHVNWHHHYMGLTLVMILLRFHGHSISCSMSVSWSFNFYLSNLSCLWEYSIVLHAIVYSGREALLIYKTYYFNNLYF